MTQATETQAERRPGVLLLIHPATGDVCICRPGEGRMGRHMILDGYNPIGPHGKAAAAVIRQQATNT